MIDQRVRPEVLRLTDDDARKYLSKGILSALQHSSLARVALEAGCDVKRISEARDEKSTLKLACVLNLLDVDDHALDTLIAAKGFMLVPLMSGVSVDVIPAAGAAIHRIGSNRAPESPGGVVETDKELIASEAENDALLAAVLDRRAAIARAKLRRATSAAA